MGEKKIITISMPKNLKIAVIGGDGDGRICFCYRRNSPKLAYAVQVDAKMLSVAK
jgi:hypothetical protein